jgi:hypothetical protein
MVTATAPPAVVTNPAAATDSVAKDAAVPSAPPPDPRIAERWRVDQGLPGKWISTSSESPATLMIRRQGDMFEAEVEIGDRTHFLRGHLESDHRLRLASEQVGKLVNPASYWTGDFSHESWVTLGTDGTYLEITFGGNRENRVLVMNRSGDSGATETASTERQRVATEIEGTWSGRFHVENAHFNITRDGEAFRAVLVSGLTHAEYRGEIAERERLGSVLLLTPVRQTGDTRDGPLFRRPLYVSPHHGGVRLEGRTDNQDMYCCAIEMRRVTEIAGVTGEDLAALFRRAETTESEFVPSGDLALLNEPDNLVWDSLSLREIREKELRLFDTGLSVMVRGIEYHHIIVRDAGGEERKAWIKWKT